MSIEAIHANPEVQAVQSYRIYGEGAVQFMTVSQEIEEIVRSLRENDRKGRTAVQSGFDTDAQAVFVQTKTSLERRLQAKIALAASIDGVHFVGFQSAAISNPVIESKDHGQIPTEKEINSLTGKSGERHHVNGFGNMNLSSVGETLRFVAPVVTATTLALIMGAVSVEAASSQDQKEVTEDLCDVDLLKVDVITPCKGRATTHTPTNVRLKPSTTESAPYYSKVVKFLESKTVVTIDGMTRGESNSIWYAVTLADGTKGFISYSLLNLEDIVAEIEAEAAPEAPTASAETSTAAAETQTTGAIETATAVDSSQLKYVVEGLPLGEIDLAKMQVEDPALYQKFIATPGMEAQMFNDKYSDSLDLGYTQLVVPPEGAQIEEIGNLGIVWLLEPVEDTTDQITGWKKVGVIYKSEEKGYCAFNTLTVQDTKKSPNFVQQGSSFILDTVFQPNKTLIVTYGKIDPMTDPSSTKCPERVATLLRKDIDVKFSMGIIYSGN